MKDHLRTVKAAMEAEFQGVREGLLAARDLSVSPPLQRPRGHRLVHGLALPWVALGHALRDSALRSAYLRVTLPVCLATLSLGVGTLVRGFLKPDDSDDSKAQTLTFDDDWIPTFEAPEPETAALPGADAKAVVVLKPAAPASRLHRIKVAYLLWLSGFYAALVAFESALMALTSAARDGLSLALSPLVGAPPPFPLDRKARRGVRALIHRLWRRGMVLALLAVGSAVPQSLRFFFPHHFGKWLSAPLTSAWVFYLVCVVALGNSEWAWEAPRTDQPFYLRLCTAVVRLPFVGWILRPYVGLVRFLAKWVRAPSVHVERCLFESAGLGISTSICAVPVLRSFLQPVLPVAAQLVLACEPGPPSPSPVPSV